MKMTEPSRKTVALVKQRDGLRCVRCGRYLEGVPASIHHRRLRSHPFTGLHEASNLICLCGTGSVGCHLWVHTHQAEAYENGWLVKGVSDLLLPQQIPVLLYTGKQVYLDDSGHYIEMEKTA